MTLTKSSIKKQFQKSPEKYWQVELFKEKGFVRKQCSKCKKFFWTLNLDRKTCADSSCVPYDSIGKPITKKKLDYIEMWKAFEKFFVKNRHASIPRYPVIDRVRPDLYFTIASIQDFQRLENGNMVFVYPKNPLIVPQMCLRFGDIPSVGLSGRHLTSFIMSGQHAFNYPNEKGSYFKDHCIELNFNFLNKVLGIPEEELVYTEDIWAMPDFSAFGPCIETFSKGVELVNSVFMQFQKSNIGFKNLDMKVVDVGWGHERLVWFSKGTNTIYESTFGPVLEKLKKSSGVQIDSNIFSEYSKLAGTLDIDEIKNVEKEREKIAKSIGVSVKELEEQIEPIKALYAITDHIRTLLFAVADGGIPSNVGGGYNLRVLLRRIFSFMDKHDFDFDLAGVSEHHAKFLKPMFPELCEGTETMQKIIDVEKQKYKNTVSNAKRIVERIVERKEKIDKKKIIQLYESQGISPEMVKEATNIDIPYDVYSEITRKHESQIKEKKKTKFSLKNLPETKKLFYEKLDKFEFKAKVLKSFGNFVVLDKTAFYPESGGQDCDLGTINNIPVKHVQKIGNIIIHELEKPLKDKKTAESVVDKERRETLKRHHTATHIINAAAGKVLGLHVNQAGAHKTTEKAHLDVTHFQNITKEELDKIEKEANKIVKRKIPVKIKILPRAEAEKKYGLKIYQGGAITGNEIRTVEIPDVDVEACAGTHCKNTSEIGEIKVLKSSKIQDGVVRITFVAGKRTSELQDKEKNILLETAKLLKVKPEHVPEAAEQLFKKWKSVRKAVKKKKSKEEIKKLLDAKIKLDRTEKRDTKTLLQKTAEIYKTQPEHITSTTKKFLSDLEMFEEDVE